MLTYQTRDGDVLDAIAYAQYGYCDDSVMSQIFAANSGIAAQGAVMPAGTMINLPDIVAPQTSSPAVKLWD
ncbi:tail protein X [Nguyenibacter vanlangensis]|uniref:Tail protein X n=1 Tax=Nguyenibacter vanlangensis TaxID=1216886 RepID=A0ABZ3D1Y6_9PROT